MTHRPGHVRTSDVGTGDAGNARKRPKNNHRKYYALFCTVDVLFVGYTMALTSLSDDALSNLLNTSNVIDDIRNAAREQQRRSQTQAAQAKTQAAEAQTQAAEAQTQAAQAKTQAADAQAQAADGQTQAAEAQGRGCQAANTS